jgi:hypothetical protein
VIGDLVIGFRASLPVGTPLRDVFGDPSLAAETLLAMVTEATDTPAQD